MAKRKSARKPKSMGEALGLKSIVDNETSNFLVGLIVLAVAIYTTIAMVSYFSTGYVDQSILENMRPGDWLNSSKELTNYCGSWGALLAYYLLNVNFGLPASSYPPFFFS